MGSRVLAAIALGVLLSACAGSAVRADFFGGVGPAITGNDTGGIFPYSPDVRHIYRRLAAEYCARWDRLSHVTSVHRRYGDYVSFVCMDRRSVIH